MTSNADYVIDASRAQNAEELAAIVSAGVNTFPNRPTQAIAGRSYFVPNCIQARPIRLG